MARHTQRGRVFGGEVREGLFSDTQERTICAFIGDLDTVA
jgi:hypothetical protein